MPEPNAETVQEPMEGAAEQAPDAPPPAPDADPQIEELRAQVEALTQERDQLQDQLLRAMADFQNARRRAQQEAENLRQFATERLVTQLLPVLDNFERTIEALDAGADPASVVEGIRAVDRQFRSVLESVQVQRIASAGHAFDPDLHEAIALEPTEEHPENTVIDEVEAGYRMADKVIRPARVRVARRP